MKTKKCLRSVIAILLLVCTLFGCEFSNVGEKETGGDSATETNGTETVSLAINGVSLSEYVAVYSKKANIGADKALSYMNEILKSDYGVTLTASTAIKDRYEILIGSDGNDPAIAEGFAKNPDGYIGVSGKKVFLLGANYGALCQVIDNFFAKVSGTGAQKEITLTKSEAVSVKKNSLRFMTYNVQQDLNKSGRSKNALSDMCASIMKISPDVFGTQENVTDIHNGFANGTSGYSCYKGATYNSDTKLGDYIYWKTDKFKLVDRGSKYMTDTPDVKSKYPESAAYRGFAYVLLECKDTGNRFLFINLHTDYYGVPSDPSKADPVRLKQLKAVTEFLKPYHETNTPIVVVGDFNAPPTKDSVVTFESDNMRLAKTLDVAKNKGDTGGTLAVTEFTVRDPYIFDYIFVTPDMMTPDYYTVENIVVNGKYPSDHLPVVADVTLY